MARSAHAQAQVQAIHAAVRRGGFEDISTAGGSDQPSPADAGIMHEAADTGGAHHGRPNSALHGARSLLQLQRKPAKSPKQPPPSAARPPPSRPWPLIKPPPPAAGKKRPSPPPQQRSPIPSPSAARTPAPSPVLKPAPPRPPPQAAGGKAPPPRAQPSYSPPAGAGRDTSTAVKFDSRCDLVLVSEWWPARLLLQRTALQHQLQVPCCLHECVHSSAARCICILVHQQQQTHGPCVGLARCLFHAAIAWQAVPCRATYMHACTVVRPTQSLLVLPCLPCLQH